MCQLKSAIRLYTIFISLHSSIFGQATNKSATIDLLNVFRTNIRRSKSFSCVQSEQGDQISFIYIAQNVHIFCQNFYGGKK
jgi:hypothetical protein